MSSPVVSMGNLSTGTTVANTTAETVLRTLKVPASLFTSSRGLRYSLAGSILGASTNNPTMIVRTRLSTSTGMGTAVMATSSIDLGTSTSARSWVMDGGVVATSTATQTHWLSLDVGAPGTVAPSTVSLVGRGSSTKDYNIALRLQLTVQMSSASTQFTVNADVGTFEVLR